MTKSTQDLKPAAKPGVMDPGTRSWIKTAMMVTGLAVAMLATNAIAAWPRNPVAALAIGPILAAAMICLYIWTGRRVERRKVEEFPSDHGVRHLLAGTGLGVLMSGATVGILALFGAYTITGWGSISGMLAVAGMMCAIAVSEEVFFRGVVFRLLHGRWGTAVALGASAILFGLVHLVNPDASLPGAFAIMIEAGIMLGAAYLATRSLWLAIGVHFGWNFATTGLFWIDHLGFRGPRFAGHRGDQRTGLAFRGKLRAGSQHRRHLGVLGGYRGIPGHCASSRPAFASTSLIARGRIIMPGQGSAFDRVQ
ncbi:hypothetical protein CQ017_11750 [Arthrobacter sp. MYb224]|uniref:CPBP family intramembrane glutamic endopeptidase n=1 Tax=Arthrobacter sp. MYb224 TaxID=1848600 RepID=UPI000CFE04CF|nr:CPBP family intramembrane glutamic endopeptidase [Arthrobacter sp. MYb224]PQZ98280.1 hypothetical protein CQ017_11750 [Arthrobacter sp. MYb224]